MGEAETSPNQQDLLQLQGMFDNDNASLLLSSMENKGIEKKYAVFVDDNFHYMDEDARYKLGEFSTYEEAVEACKRIVDEFLESAYEQGMSFDELYGGYINWGEDPFIVPNDKTNWFSAWDYAKARSRELCSK